MELTIYSIIYLITAVLSFLVALLSWQRKSVVGALELFILSASISVCAYCLFFEAASTSVTGKIIWSKLSYVFVVTIPVFYYLFVLRFTKLLRFKDLKYGWMLFVFPLITLLLALTNEFHHLIWSGFSQIAEETNIMTYHHGFWFWIGYMLYSYVLLLISTFLLFEFDRNNRRNKIFQYQGWLILTAGLIPWIVSVFYLTGINPVEGLDITPISTTISTLLFSIAILKSSFLNLVPVARETLMETLPVGIIALDNQNRIQDINLVARVLLKIESDDVLGLSPTGIPSFAESFRDAIVSAEPSSQVEVNEKEGFKSFRIIKQPIKALSGSRLITIYDITEEIIRQKELFEAKRRAEESDHLKSAFLANMSHEIRTPMNSIMGFISVLKETTLTSQERVEYLDIVRNNGDRLLKTVNDIVDISKIESGQVRLNLSDFDVNEILSDMYGLFYNEAKLKGLDYNKPEMVAPDFSYIRSDKEKMYSITTNLIKNALKYTNEGYVAYRFSVGKSSLVFSVEDSGIGIPKDKTQFIFDRFTQINSSRKKTFEGAGLGLAITKAYVDMLGGKIQIESEEGEGSTFTVTIPVEHVQSGGLLFKNDTLPIQP